MNATNLAYRTWGIREGVPLVLLHGFLGDSGDWEDLAGYLESDLYLVAVDLPGHGKSRDVKVSQDNAFEAFSELLRGTLCQLGLDHYSVLGYSLGGRLAMSHLALAEESIDRLLVESSHPGLEDNSERQARWKNDQDWAEQFRNDPLNEVLQRWYHQPVFADLNSRERERLMQHRSSSHQIEGLSPDKADANGESLAWALEAFSLSRQPEFCGVLNRSSEASHYFCGERDLKFQDIAHRLLEMGCVNSVHKIKEAGHNIHRERPEAMAAIIRQLLL
ncbi:2-succinyl-6-hydroxy-2,4-cyclohexadiene-1-carboxylate synthase [Endozoicomonas sp. 8E]|uniref:2-succinyl-6-hydroxy-2, 4-cyclohexadiene-1-carboxylate synthase n=1 Tax=Endozoicomonas sp. 8E TaxID=3035692 RepID=UPI00293934DC|nr:2-succinyl-6-hydroxy-2,4-cyclohexadiene-1-carboxylate synthase [Endozoicomonas sp. 8E]WOG26324.1 2-succinyl-6-hydroxy-2,4-cyclohexadiene-1-carboxylate synthase [Endozoicomonas sp. 8E]